MTKIEKAARSCDDVDSNSHQSNNHNRGRKCSSDVFHDGHNENDLSNIICTNIINEDNITAAWTRLTFSTAAAAVAAMPSSCSDDTAQR